MLKFTAVATVMAGALVLPAAASAHVTLQPKEAAAEGYTVENVRVPNETDDAATTKVQVQFPEGFASVSYEKVPGWDVDVTSTKLATPIKTDDGEITEGVKEITFTADSDKDGIQPGEFQDFPLSMKIPGKAGDTLTFKSVQTYDDGEVVRWIGAPETDKPAPTIAVTAPAAEHGAAAPAKTATPVADVAPAAAKTDDFASEGLGIAALIAGGLGLLLGLAALLVALRRKGADA